MLFRKPTYEEDKLSTERAVSYKWNERAEEFGCEVFRDAIRSGKGAHAADKEARAAVEYIWKRLAPKFVKRP